MQEDRTVLNERFWKVKPNSGQHVPSNLDYSQIDVAAAPAAQIQAFNHAAIDAHDTPKMIDFYTKVEADVFKTGLYLWCME